MTAPPPDLSSMSLNEDPFKDPDNVLTGKQEHYLKRELISRQVQFEISELNSPTALQRFGAPFQSPLGEVAPVDSELPILRYIFVNHVRNFPFLDQAREKEFWQDRLQVFLESFATKRISSSEDRLEETKRRKLALKCEKVVELMMNSGIPTASGYEEQVGFDEIEAAGGADRQANESALLANVPEGNSINGLDVNVACVRQTSVKRNIRYHTHAEFIIRTKRKGESDIIVGRRYGAFKRLHRDLHNELPGKVLPPVPRKMRASQSTTSAFLLAAGMGPTDDASSMDSSSTVDSASLNGQMTPQRVPSRAGHKKSQSLGATLGLTSSKSLSRRASRQSLRSEGDGSEVTTSSDFANNGEPISLWRENQRVSLRAFLRQLLHDQQIARSTALLKFLFDEPIKLNEEEQIDEARRRAMDEIRLEEQRKFYEVARKRARELDVYMESFRREIVESNGLTKLFAEIRAKDKLADLSLQYQKFAEWLRIEVAAMVYHIFLAEDNSAELFMQCKRIHSLIPYTILKNIIRVANPAAVMNGVLDLFLATPFKSRSLMQRILGMAIGDGIKNVQKSIDILESKIDDPVLCGKLKAFTDAEEDVREDIRRMAKEESIDLIVVVLRSEDLGCELLPQQIEKTFNGYVAYESAVDNIDQDIKASAQFFAYLKQLMKLYTRQRDKRMMLSMIEEPVTLQLFRDLFTIFYEPLVRVYKSANVYNSVTDFAMFVDDIIQVVERAQSQDMSTDPNLTVQSFIDLCARHENNFYKFVHEVHLHDDGLFTNLMAWLEDILTFLRHGPQSGGKLDMNALFTTAAKNGTIDPEKAINEINALIGWQARRRRWHEEKTRQKMATGTEDGGWSTSGPGGLSPRDFGIGDVDLEELEMAEDEGSSDDDEEGDLLDPIQSDRRRKQKKQDLLRRRAGEPEKPVVEELVKLGPGFLSMLRQVLA